MDNRQRAVLALAFRERALAGQWIARRIKIALLAIAAGLAMVLWGACSQPEPVTIGLVCFMSGAVLTIFSVVFANSRLIRKAWPFIEFVTDWNRVREIAGGQPVKPPASPPGTPPDSN